MSLRASIRMASILLQGPTHNVSFDHNRVNVVVHHNVLFGTLTDYFVRVRLYFDLEKRIGGMTRIVHLKVSVSRATTWSRKNLAVSPSLLLHVVAAPCLGLPGPVAPTLICTLWTPTQRQLGNSFRFEKTGRWRWADISLWQ